MYCTKGIALKYHCSVQTDGYLTIFPKVVVAIDVGGAFWVYGNCCDLFNALGAWISVYVVGR